ncbi:MAG: hypothetical protein ABUT39_23470 [Acidobacteriota bacterium]
MSTSSKAQAAAAPLKSGKGMSGTNPDDSANKPGGGGGGGGTTPGQGHGPGHGKGKKGSKG